MNTFLKAITFSMLAAIAWSPSPAWVFTVSIARCNVEDCSLGSKIGHDKTIWSGKCKTWHDGQPFTGFVYAWISFGDNEPCWRGTCEIVAYEGPKCTGDIVGEFLEVGALLHLVLNASIPWQLTASWSQANNEDNWQKPLNFTGREARSMEVVCRGCRRH